MTIAYWCVFVIILFPFLFAALAKTSSAFNNHDPRKYLQNLTGWRQRAHYIQLNSFEILPSFGIAVIVANLLHAHQSNINILALIFVVSRAFYAIFYLADKPSFRSLCWAVGMVCIIGLFIISMNKYTGI